MLREEKNITLNFIQIVIMEISIYDNEKKNMQKIEGHLECHAYTWKIFRAFEKGTIC